MPKPRKTGAAKAAGAKETKEAKKGAAAKLAQSALSLPDPKDMMHHLLTVKGFKAKAATANSHLRDARKKAKEAGVDMAALDGYMAFERMDDSEVRRELEQLSVYMRENGHPLQLTIFETKFKDSVTEAKSRGRRDAENNKHADDPFPAGSKESEAYGAAYDEVTAERLGVKQPDVAVEGEHGSSAKPDRDLWDEQADRVVGEDDHDEEEGEDHVRQPQREAALAH